MRKFDALKQTHNLQVRSFFDRAKHFYSQLIQKRVYVATSKQEPRHAPIMPPDPLLTPCVAMGLRNLLKGVTCVQV